MYNSLHNATLNSTTDVRFHVQVQRIRLSRTPKMLVRRKHNMMFEMVGVGWTILSVT